MLQLPTDQPNSANAVSYINTLLEEIALEELAFMGAQEESKNASIPVEVKENTDKAEEPAEVTGQVDIVEEKQEQKEQQNPINNDVHTPPSTDSSTDSPTNESKQEDQIQIQSVGETVDVESPTSTLTSSMTSTITSTSSLTDSSSSIEEEEGEGEEDVTSKYDVDDASCDSEVSSINNVAEVDATTEDTIIPETNFIDNWITNLTVHQKAYSPPSNGDSISPTISDSSITKKTVPAQWIAYLLLLIQVLLIQDIFYQIYMIFKDTESHLLL